MIGDGHNKRISPLVDYGPKEQVNIYSPSVLYSSIDSRYVLTSSFNGYSASQSSVNAALDVYTGSLNAFTASVAQFTASVAQFTASLSPVSGTIAYWGAAASLSGNLNALRYQQSDAVFKLGLNGAPTALWQIASSLPSASGSFIELGRSQTSDGGNVSMLRTVAYRNSSSAVWTGADQYMQKMVDLTRMGFVGWYTTGGKTGQIGLGLGSEFTTAGTGSSPTGPSVFIGQGGGICMGDRGFANPAATIHFSTSSPNPAVFVDQDPGVGGVAGIRMIAPSAAFDGIQFYNSATYAYWLGRDGGASQFYAYDLTNNIYIWQWVSGSKTFNVPSAVTASFGGVLSGNLMGSRNFRQQVINGYLYQTILQGTVAAQSVLSYMNGFNVSTRFVAPFSGSISAITCKVYNSVMTAGALTASITKNGSIIPGTTTAWTFQQINAVVSTTYTPGACTFGPNDDIVLQVASSGYAQGVAGSNGIELALYVLM